MQQNITRVRNGVVLAAGLGSRMAKTGRDHNMKPLVAVDGKALLLRTLTSLELACDRAVVVLGHRADGIRSFVEDHYRGPLQLVFVINPKYHQDNGLSVLAARSHVDGDFLLCMADHIMGDELLEIAGNCTPPANGAALLVDYKLDTIFDMDDATKVMAVNGGIKNIGKQLTHYNCIDTGLFVCSEALFATIAGIYDHKGNASLSDGIQKLAKQGVMRAIDIGDGFWQDVDNAEMLLYAERKLAMRKANLQLQPDPA